MTANDDPSPVADGVTAAPVAPGVVRLGWSEEVAGLEFRAAVARVAEGVERALAEHHRVEALVPVDDTVGQRIATWSGLRREGVARGVHRTGEHPDVEHVDRIVYARVAGDLAVHEPEGFRSLLNSFLPRKRAIAQMLVRDPEGRVLLCRLTYKQDWDLPGGVVEPGESPRLGVSREVREELALAVDAGELLLVDWLPPWGGWDDALCLVFDGGEHPPSVLEDVVRQEREIRDVAFCTLAEVAERAADFTARRVESALAALESGTAYSESGR